MAEVTVTGEAGTFVTRIAAGDNALVSDEPIAAGGTGAGANPYELLLAALGACTSMTLFVYSRTKGWPLQRVSVTLRHERIHAADCADCEAKHGRIDRI